MALDLVIANVRLDGRAEWVDIGILAEQIATIAPRIENEAPREDGIFADSGVSDSQKK